MRPLKFRAWDNKNKKFPFMEFNLIGEVSAFDLISQYQLEELCNLEIEQYTDKKDIDGVEICEGDIIEETRVLHNGSCVTNKVVSYKAPSFHVGDLAMSGYNGISWRVIGNIHENPELISI